MALRGQTVYLVDQLSRKVSGNDRREGNQYYNVPLVNPPTPPLPSPRWPHTSSVGGAGV